MVHHPATIKGLHEKLARNRTPEDQYFGYYDCNFEKFKTEKEAIDWCNSWLDEERGGIWSDESMNICYGKIIGGTAITRSVDVEGMTDEEMEDQDIWVPADCTFFEERKILAFE